MSPPLIFHFRRLANHLSRRSKADSTGHGNPCLIEMNISGNRFGNLLLLHPLKGDAISEAEISPLGRETPLDGSPMQRGIYKY